MALVVTDWTCCGIRDCGKPECRTCEVGRQAQPARDRDDRQKHERPTLKGTKQKGKET